MASPYTPFITYRRLFFDFSTRSCCLLKRAAIPVLVAVLGAVFASSLPATGMTGAGANSGGHLDRALFATIEKDDLEGVRTLVARGARLEARDWEGNTPLILASFDCPESVDVLLAHGAAVDARNYRGETALLEAARFHQTAVVRKLLDHGADVNAAIPGGSSPLMQAVEFGPAMREEPSQVATTRLLLERGADVKYQRKDGVTALMVACGPTLITAILQKDPDVNAIDGFHYTALMYAAMSGTGEMVRLLLEKGAQVDARDKAGETALLYELKQGFMGDEIEKVRVLLNYHPDVNQPDIKGTTPLEAAMQPETRIRNRGLLVKLLLASGANINARRVGGATVLMRILQRWDSLPNSFGLKRLPPSKEPWHASLRERASLVQILLDGNADVNARDDGGATSLMYLIYVDDEGDSPSTLESSEPEPVTIPGIVKLLIAHGAQIDAADKMGKTPLIIATRWGCRRVVQILINSKANLELMDNIGRTALDWAVADHRMALARILQTSGARTGVSPAQQASPLDVTRQRALDAAFIKSIDFKNEVRVKWLLDHGADVNARSLDSDRTALMIAVNRECWWCQTAQLLLLQGAKVNAVDRDGNTALTLTYPYHPEWTNVLLDAGAWVNVRNKQGRTALMCAVIAYVRSGFNITDSTEEQSFTTVIKELLARGAHINAKDAAGRTPLMLAVSTKFESFKGYTEVSRTRVIKLLIALGADLNARDIRGQTAEMIARANHRPELVPVLRAARAASHSQG